MRVLLDSPRKPRRKRVCCHNEQADEEQDDIKPIEASTINQGLPTQSEQPQTADKKQF